ncbi:MAG: hypothetical protein GX410_04950 [Elusimicrobia bacterium]|nr:hypothetical protein [Elusimicrobiota bacterium]
MNVLGNEYSGLAIGLSQAAIKPEFEKLQARQIARCFKAVLSDLLGHPPSDAQLYGSEPLAAPADRSTSIG